VDELENVVIPRLGEPVQQARRLRYTSPISSPDQIETGSAYHDVPEGHMKAANPQA
jgi:hypothetical protein